MRVSPSGPVTYPLSHWSAAKIAAARARPAVRLVQGEVMRSDSRSSAKGPPSPAGRGSGGGGARRRRASTPRASSTPTLPSPSRGREAWAARGTSSAPSQRGIQLRHHVRAAIAKRAVLWHLGQQPPAAAALGVIGSFYDDSLFLGECHARHDEEFSQEIYVNKAAQDRSKIVDLNLGLEAGSNDLIPSEGLDLFGHSF